MIDLKDVVKKERAKVQIKAPAAGEPGNGKTPAELENEILENHKAMLESAAKKSAAKNDLIEHETKPIKESELEIHTTKPIIPTHMDCPYCEEEKTIRGMSRHIKSIHGIPGISLEDLNRIEQGEITPDALATEKGTTEIFGLSPEIDKKYFSSWEDTEEDPEDPEVVEDPEEKAAENGGIGLLPILFIVGIPVALVLSRIPKFKEFSDKLLAILGDLGSNKSPDSRNSPSTNFSSHWGNRRF